MAIPSILDAAHRFAADGIREGGLAIDATVGNGYDTVFLLRQVGSAGRVLGFDVQSAALSSARKRVEKTVPEPSDRLRLIQDGHESMSAHLNDGDQGAVDAIMFNLGYLPGGDHSITTQPDTTRRGLEESRRVLRPGGIITIVVYPGHDGGGVEAQVVEDWASSLPQSAFQALSYTFVNQKNDPPRLVVVQKRGNQDEEASSSE